MLRESRERVERSRSLQPLELMHGPRSEAHARSGGERSGHLGDEDRVRLGSAGDPCGLVDRDASDVAGDDLDLPGMDSGADSKAECPASGPYVGSGPSRPAVAVEATISVKTRVSRVRSPTPIGVAQVRNPSHAR